MWKFFSRGVREAVERNVGRTSELRVQKDKQHINQCHRLAPFVNSRWKHFGSSKENDSQENGGSSTQNCRASWFNAFGCSGALALGWMLAQPCLWRKWCGLPDKRKSVKDSTVRLFDLISSTAWTQPILPVSRALTPRSVSFELTDEPVQGPKTAEETFNTAAEEFYSLHNAILAEIENKRGVDLINRKKTREALELFLSASHRGYGPAAYNLGQCFEMGIGIKQNFHEAAKWYQKAADRGHLTAMYNLGVFYVHGWGGLNQNTKKARELFEEAAKQGQPDAKAALGIEKAPIQATTAEGLAKQDLWNDESHDATQLTDISRNKDEIFKLAFQFDSSLDPDPITSQLTLELYKIAADMGHTEAKSRLEVLQAVHFPDFPAESEKQSNLSGQLFALNL